MHILKNVLMKSVTKYGGGGGGEEEEKYLQVYIVHATYQ
jgi:hypothetical protein